MFSLKFQSFACCSTRQSKTVFNYVLNTEIDHQESSNVTEAKEMFDVDLHRLFFLGRMVIGIM